MDGYGTTDEGAWYGVSLSASSDVCPTGMLSWTIDWGDGTAPSTRTGNDSYAYHMYADGYNSYTITATVAEDATYGSDTQTYTDSVEVLNVKPTFALTGSNYTVSNATYTLTPGVVSDPGTDTVTQWKVDWDDGTGVATYPAATTQFTHDYAAGPGADRAIKVWAVDEDGDHEKGKNIRQQDTVLTTDLAPEKNNKINIVQGGQYRIMVSASGEDTGTAVPNWELSSDVDPPPGGQANGVFVTGDDETNAQGLAEIWINVGELNAVDSVFTVEISSPDDPDGSKIVIEVTVVAPD